MPKRAQPAQQTSQLQLLEKAKEILSEFSQIQDAENKNNLQKQFLQILPRLNEFFQETLLLKENNELKIDIVKLIKQQLRKADSIFASSDKNSQEQLTKFVFLASKSTAKQNQFQTDLANYFKRKFINIDSVLIEKEGIIFQKNPDGTYSKKPAGTADVVIKIINKKGEVIAQYCIECDGKSHTDAAKDDLRNTYLSNNSNGFLCLKHGNIDFADYLLKTENSQYKEELNKILEAIRENHCVRNAQEERRLLLEQEKKKFSEKLTLSKNKFEPLSADESTKLKEEEIESKTSTELTRTRSKKSFKTDHVEKFLEQYRQIAQQELDLIEAFHKNIDEEKWDDLLNQVLEICKKPKEDQIDKYLLTIAKPYIAELLKTNYKHKCFESECFLAKLKDFNVEPDQVLYIINKFLQNNSTFIESPKKFQTLIGSLLNIPNLKSHPTVLERCCYYGYLDLFKYLHFHKKPSKQDLISCLEECSHGNSNEIAELLLEQNKILPQEKTKSLCIAAFEGNLEMVRVLLENGVDVNSANYKGYVALTLAAQEGHKEVVKLLLERGADVDSKLEMGETALMLAAQEGHKEVVELLLERGADVNLKNKHGITALLDATQFVHTEVVKLLLERGADVDSKLEMGETALLIASQNGYIEIVKLLLARGANVNLKLKTGETALMLATQFGHKEVVELLLERGVDVNLKNKHGITALMLAAQFGHKEVVKLLLERGADVNLQDEEDITATRFAGQFGHREIVALLMEHLKPSTKPTPAQECSKKSRYSSKTRP